MLAAQFGASKAEFVFASEVALSVDRNRPTLLIISQVYVPDPAAVGQHTADAAAEMVRRGWRVIVYTANRGYEDPSVKYPLREVIDGVEVRRLPLSSFGKKSIPLRVIGGILFLLQAVCRGVMARNLSCVLVSTSPPMCAAAALIIGAIRRVSIKYWVMDLNPDQLVALGWASETSPAVIMLNIMNRMILRRANDVIALDRFMVRKLISKESTVESKLSVIPPWPLETLLENIEHKNNPFRTQQGWNGKFVIMFSGNLSLASPVDTVLQAALRLKDEPDLVLAFVGGGQGKKLLNEFLDEHRPDNIVSLPYQPRSQLKYSLSAADVHLMTMGDWIVGVCHPCKVYGAMAVGRPILFLGPDKCHVSDILADCHCGWHIKHGDVEAAEQVLRQILRTSRDELAIKGKTAKQWTMNRFGDAPYCGEFCDVLERPSVMAASGSAEIADT